MTGRWVLGGSGTATVLLGLLLLIRPDWGATVFYTVLGVYLALMGVTNLWDGLRRRRHPSRNRLLLGGALSLLAGIAAIANPMIALAVFPGVLLIVAGVLAILFGVVQVSQFRVRELGRPSTYPVGPGRGGGCSHRPWGAGDCPSRGKQPGGGAGRWGCADGGWGAAVGVVWVPAAKPDGLASFGCNSHGSDVSAL